ncbi:ESX-1 secretion-associated protein EspC [Mycobacterium europaeum]|uniref:ESX-1 secretion-associated protein EspC n=1 Tax=Mycobacterium europaeum TaxID=761804 RepID=A0A0U1DRZ1_9MYCO|nr:ESX-1 secretion-associated protein [Mycobacterium europaeum]CQD21604.1 ESX-1 secretion-associated protein EspC [Mycobacterium europaeum]
MADLIVTPEHLKKLATAQDQAATRASTAGTAGDNIKAAVWVTHGIVSGASNVAFTNAAAARKSTAEAMSKASTELSGKLRTARAVYQSADDETSRNIDAQVLER